MFSIFLLKFSLCSPISSPEFGEHVYDNNLTYLSGKLSQFQSYFSDVFIYVCECVCFIWNIFLSNFV